MPPTQLVRFIHQEGDADVEGVVRSVAARDAYAQEVWVEGLAARLTLEGE